MFEAIVHVRGEPGNECGTVVRRNDVPADAVGRLGRRQRRGQPRAADLRLRGE
ncbi:MAG: hypothetical protein ABEI99_00795 [Halobaculum sp.]